MDFQKDFSMLFRQGLSKGEMTEKFQTSGIIFLDFLI